MSRNKTKMEKNKLNKKRKIFKPIRIIKWKIVKDLLMRMKY